MVVLSYRQCSWRVPSLCCKRGGDHNHVSFALKDTSKAATVVADSPPASNSVSSFLFSFFMRCLGRTCWAGSTLPKKYGDLDRELERAFHMGPTYPRALSMYLCYRSNWTSTSETPWERKPSNSGGGIFSFCSSPWNFRLFHSIATSSIKPPLFRIRVNLVRKVNWDNL